MAERSGVLAITILRRDGEGWPAVAELRREDELPLRREGRLELDLTALAGRTGDYGRGLGDALFSGAIGEAWTLARARCPDRLHLALRVDDPELRALRWEALEAPIDGARAQVRLDQRTPFSLEVASESERLFPPLVPADLRALLLVTSPSDLADYGMAHFDTLAALQCARDALAPIPSDVLAFGIPGAIGAPTLEGLCAALTARRYAILHLVCHGAYVRGGRETLLYLADDDETTAPAPADKLLRRLGRLGGEVGLPHLTFLCACESAAPEAEGALGGLGQRLVRELGLPAVVAMRDRISVDTATALIGPFYRQLALHGLADLALTEASTQIAERRDIAAPVALLRAAGKPLVVGTGPRSPAPAAPAAGPPPIFAAARLPLSLGARFVGRDAELAALFHELKDDACDAVALVSPAGFGKTRLALELMWRHRAAFPGGIFWLSAAAAERRAATFHHLLTQLDPDCPPFDVLRARGEDLGPRLALAVRALRPGLDKLWVVEDIPEPAPGAPPFDLQAWCPAWGEVAVLALARARLPDPELPHRVLGPLAQGDAALLLQAAAPIAPALARRVAEWVGGMPLALELLGKSLALGDLAEDELAELVERGSVARVLGDAEAVLAGALGGGDDPLIPALRASYASLAPDAQRLARLLAQLGPDPLPSALVKAFGADAGRPARAALVARSFVTGLSGHVFGTMHRVLADFLRGVAAEDEPARAREVLRAGLDVDLDDPRRWPELVSWAVHAEALVLRLPGDEPAVDLALHVGRLYLNVDRHDAAVRVLRRAAELAAALPPGCELALIAALVLAAALHERGDQREALALQEQALAATLAARGPDDLLTSGVQREIAGTLRDLGQRRRALEIYDTVLDRWRAQLGRDAPETLSLELGRAITLLVDDDPVAALAAALALLPRLRDPGERLVAAAVRGGALLDLGRLPEALEVLAAAHRDAAQFFGPDHSSTLDVACGLLQVLHARGDLRPALALAEEILPRLERAVGPDHPQTFACRQIHLRLVGELGDWPRARALARAAAAAALARYGDRHPSTASFRGDLGLAALELLDLDEARLNLQLASDYFELSHGPEHPAAERARAALAELALQEGRVAEARPRLADLAARAASRLGDDHPEVLIRRNNLGLALLSLDPTAARDLYQDLVARSRRVLGDDHPHTLARAALLSRALLDAGDPAAALALGRTNLAATARALGEDHPDVLAQRVVVALALRATGDPAAGEVEARRALAALAPRLPPGHTKVRDANLALGYCLADQGSIDAAYPFFAAAEPALARQVGDDHPALCALRFDLAAIDLQLGRPEPAAARLRELLPRATRAWGPDALYTLLAEHNLALADAKLGRLDEALARLEALLPRARAALGEHPALAGFAQNLAALQAKVAARRAP